MPLAMVVSVAPVAVWIGGRSRIAGPTEGGGRFRPYPAASMMAHCATTSNGVAPLDRVMRLMFPHTLA
jgi:hypothetical protein